VTRNYVTSFLRGRRVQAVVTSLAAVLANLVVAVR
jgi:hypothetical protein